MFDFIKVFCCFFENGFMFGFIEVYKWCCMNFCGGIDYMVCKDLFKYVIFDSIYFIEVVWKVVINFYIYFEGFIKGFILDKWF